jgi:uncharacterized protein
VVEVAMRQVSVVAVFMLVLACAHPGWAQSSPAAAPDTPSSAHKLELARQVVDASGANTAMSGMIRGEINQLVMSGSGNLSPERQERLQVIGHAQADAFAKMAPKIVDSLVEGYARQFTEQELTDMLAFYRSPSGRAIVTKTPQVMQGLIVEMARLMPQMRRDMGEEICAKVTCTASERTAYFGSADSK